MKETTQQYMQRVLGYVEGKDPLKVQESTPSRLQKLTKPLTKRDLSARPAPDKWSIQEIVAHLAECELVAGWRIRMILNTDGAEIQAFDQDSWARTSDYAHADVKRSLELFRVLRAANLDLLNSIPKEKWNSYGMHQERGKETIAHIVRMFAGHDLNHLQQVEHLAKKPRAKAAARS
jgi:hypothetical protein